MSFALTLLDWYDRYGRDLPWRHLADPYATWVSEIILQQTRIQQGTDYWHRFMRHWPRVEDLAAASEDEVLREWQGLGYYSRARNLHSAAKQIVEQGHFPNTFEDIRKLKGVGDYTAAAIASIAFGQPVAAVDGNVYRVLARHYGIETPIDTSLGKKHFTQLAQTLLPTDRPAAFNQALMDFGAIQCTPTSPRCEECPLQETCEAFRSGMVNHYPVKERKTAQQIRHLTYVYIRCQGHTALRRRPSGSIWQGLWEPPCVEHENPSKPCAALLTQHSPTLLRRGVRHILTHRVLLADFFLLETDKQPSLPEEYIWMPESEVSAHAVPRLVEILLESVNAS